MLIVSASLTSLVPVSVEVLERSHNIADIQYAVTMGVYTINHRPPKGGCCNPPVIFFPDNSFKQPNVAKRLLCNLH